MANVADDRRVWRILSRTLAAVAVEALWSCGWGTHALPPVGGPALTTDQGVAMVSPDLNFSNTWTTLAPMPTKRSAAAVGVIGTKIYVAGGFGKAGVLGTLEIYDAAANTWSTGAPMPTKRWTAAGAVVSGIFYAIGGDDGSGAGFLKVVEAYNPTSNTWSTKAPMPTARNSIVSTVDSGKIYVVGGFNGARLATVESYNPATNAWSRRAPMTLAKSDPFVGTIGTTTATIIAAGGLANTGLTVTDVEAYNPVANSWSARAPMPTPRQAGCAAGINGVLYAAGGTQSTPPLSRLDGYKNATNKWSPLLPIPKAPILPGSAVVNNLLYCIGGANKGYPIGTNPTFYNDVQAYQP